MAAALVAIATPPKALRMNDIREQQPTLYRLHNIYKNGLPSCPLA